MFLAGRRGVVLEVVSPRRSQITQKATRFPVSKQTVRFQQSLNPLADRTERDRRVWATTGGPCRRGSALGWLRAVGYAFGGEAPHVARTRFSPGKQTCCGLHRR